MKALPAPEPEPEKKVYVKPTEVWMPSMGGKPMPLGQEGTYGAVERNPNEYVYERVRDADLADVLRRARVRVENEIADAMRYGFFSGADGAFHSYPKRPETCGHRTKRYTPGYGWRCPDCGAKL